MKRWPILVSFVLFVGLCASGTFWAMQLFKPAVRQVAMPKKQPKVEIDPEAAIALFGGRPVEVAAASNFQLRGVVVSNNAEESVAILVADSKPAEAVRANSEIVPGVTVTEVHSQYVLLSEGGVVKRVELPATAPAGGVESPIAMAQPAPAVPPAMQNAAPPTEQAAPMPPPNPPSGRGNRARRRRNNNNNNNDAPPNLNND